MLLYGFNGGVMFNQVDFAFSFLNESRAYLNDGWRQKIVSEEIAKKCTIIEIYCWLYSFFLWFFLDSFIQWLRFSAVNCSGQYNPVCFANG